MPPSARGARSRRRVARGGAVLVVMVGLLGVAACSGSPSSSKGAAAPGTPTTAAPPTAAGPGDPTPAPLTWTPCQDGLQCAGLAVPVDYAEPTGAHVTLAVVRRPARDQAQRIGALVVNPGGPGASGITMVTDGYGTTDGLDDRFDIVSWDPRGIGLSQPLACGSGATAFEALNPEPSDAAEQTQLDQAAQGIAADCHAHAGPLLDHMDTATTARDLEQLRRALGEPKLTYAGYSYGTAIGLAYADRYPTHIRAMVLDGVVPPNADLTQLLSVQTDALDRSLRAVFATCDTDRTCPLTDAAATYDALAARLAAHRLAAGSTTIGPSELATAAVESTYDPSGRAPFLSALAQADHGDGSQIATLAETYHDAVPSFAGYVGVLCVDRAHPVGAAAYAAFAARLTAQSPRLGAAIANEVLPCAFWPAPVAAPPRIVTAAGSPEILVVGNTGDAATPLSSANAVAHQLAHAVLLTYDGPGHTSLGRSACADSAVRRYLVELVAPPPHSLCEPAG